MLNTIFGPLPAGRRKALLTTFKATVRFNFTGVLGSNEPVRIITIDAYSKAWFLKEVLRMLADDGVADYVTSIEVKAP
jgi:hypothetical protein